MPPAHRAQDNTSPQTGKTEADYEAFRASAGSWKDVDTDRLIEDIYASRETSRPPVDLNPV